MRSETHSTTETVGTSANSLTSRSLTNPSLVQELRRVVRQVCVKAGRPELFEDALQEANVVCVEMIRKYDPNKGVPIVSYLRPHAYWTALHFCRDNSGAFTIPERMWRARRNEGEDDLSAAIYTVSLQYDDDDEKCGSDRMGRVPAGERVRGVCSGHVEREPSIWRTLEYGHLNTLIERLEPNEQTVVHRFGEGFGCAEIAREMGVSRQRIHQVLHRAFSKIRLWWEAPTVAA